MIKSLTGFARQPGVVEVIRIVMIKRFTLALSWFLSGTVQIFKLADQFELLGSAAVGEDVYATPAFVGRRMFVRGITHLFCLEEAE